MIYSLNSPIFPFQF